MLQKHYIFILILAFAAITRSILLCQSQTHVHSDEAIIGLMGKHISEGLYFPFYMYGQPYNAGAAWEAYLAAIPFAVFGVDAVLLKGCICMLSLVCLVLFYRLALALYGQRMAELSALIFALLPSLLKWHFQVRGYSWYFLSIPVLTALFLSIEPDSDAKGRRIFLFGLASGLSVWSLELVLALTATLWILLVIRRKLTARTAALGAAGFILGYTPAVVFNFTHHFSNWLVVFGDKSGGGGIASLFHVSTISQILFQEMPKFFGPDTVLWYYPEIPLSGVILYVVALAAVAAAAFPFLKAPAKIRRALCGDLPESGEQKDFLLLVLTAASFVPYLAAPMRVPGYFLGGGFFLSILTARLLVRCFNASTKPLRIFGVMVLLLIIVTGVAVMIDVGRHNQIETLTLNKTGDSRMLARFPGKDIEAMEEHLRQKQIPAVWTTGSFVYPLIFESDEALVVSGSIFGFDHHVYPKAIPWRVPREDLCGVFVIETDSPLRPAVEARCRQATGMAPSVTEYGTLTVIEQSQR
jgi:hypothetical protein